MKRLAAIVTLLAPLLLTGCGGGLYIGWGGGGDDDGDPSVSITSAQSSVAAGGVLRIAAAASDDDSGIDSVAFYRIDGGIAQRLGSDGSEPYQWDVGVPADGRAAVSVFARARDGAGNESDSAVLTIPVNR